MQPNFAERQEEIEKMWKCILEKCERKFRHTTDGDKDIKLSKLIFKDIKIQKSAKNIEI